MVSMVINSKVYLPCCMSHHVCFPPSEGVWLTPLMTVCNLITHSSSANLTKGNLPVIAYLKEANLNNGIMAGNKINILISLNFRKFYKGVYNTWNLTANIAKSLFCNISSLWRLYWSFTFGSTFAHFFSTLPTKSLQSLSNLHLCLPSRDRTRYAQPRPLSIILKTFPPKSLKVMEPLLLSALERLSSSSVTPN